MTIVGIFLMGAVTAVAAVTEIAAAVLLQKAGPEPPPVLIKPIPEPIKKRHRKRSI